MAPIIAPQVEKLHKDEINTLLQERYLLKREVGRGGMGLVYLGHDARLDRPVAIKVVLPRLDRRPTDSAEFRSRDALAREARLGANLLPPLRG